MERVLCHHPGGDHYYCIDVEGGRAWPVLRECSVLDSEIQAGKLLILERDEYLLGLRMDAALTEKQRQNRDAAWKVIQGLIEDPAKRVYDRRTSGPVIRKAAESHQVHITSVYKYLRRYWQRGQLIDSLQPDLHKCGGPNKFRIPGDKKLGTVNINGEHVGINVNEDVRGFFEDSIKKYYHTEKRLPFTMVYDKMLIDHYTVSYEMRNGAMAPILAPPEKRPSFAQFRYYYDKNHRKIKSLRARVGPIYYQQNCQDIATDQTKTAMGIGDIYQIDSTTADVYLVHSKKTGRVAGRPVVYLVIDTFSELVVGLHVTFFNASYNAAAMSIWNAYCDKVEYCASVGVKLDNPAHWPAKGLPHSYLADRGELLSRKSDIIGEHLHITMDNTQPYSPRGKAFVERHFRLRNDEVIKWLPGAVPDDEYKKGKADYRKKASLTIEEFTEALVRSILAHNVCMLSGYQRSPAMIRDNVEPRPYKIWGWALEHANHLKDMDALMVRLGLLPRETGTVTEHGIRFKTLFYTCAKARLEEWFSSVNACTNNWQVPCSYDPGRVDNIFLLGKTAADTNICELQTSCREFAGWSWASMDNYREQERKMYLAGKQEDRQVWITSQAQATEIANQANERRKENGPPDVKHIAETQADQKAREEQKASNYLQKMAGTNAIQSTPSTSTISMPPAEQTNVEERWLKMWAEKKKLKQEGRE